MTKKLLLFSFFWASSPFVLFLSFLLLFSFSLKSDGKILGTMVSPLPFGHLYAALPAEAGTITAEAKVEDGRCLVIENYLKKYNSPLIPYAKNLCEAAKKYELDYRLLVAIAQQESNLCKASPPEWFNCWGWGIHSQGIKTFESYEEAIESVARGIKTKYCDKGYCADPCLMMKKYTPKSDGSWCFGVKKFLAEMETGI
jgi:hypothetical protein